MEDGDVERDGGDGQQDREAERIDAACAEQSEDERAGDGLDERGHEDERQVRVLGLDAAGVYALELGGGVGGSVMRVVEMVWPAAGMPGIRRRRSRRAMRSC